MRPIDKGGWPVNNGTRIIFKKHTEARPSLEHNTGRYCHFCEMPILNAPSVGLSNIQQTKALDTVNLYGLTRMTDSTGGIDIRYSKRMDALRMAISRLFEYNQTPRQTTVQGIVDNARATGFWSVWYGVFSNEPAVLQALLNHDDFGHLKVLNCFPAPDFQPVDRNPHSQPDTI